MASSKIVAVIIANLLALGVGVAFAQSDGTADAPATADSSEDVDFVSADDDSSVEGDDDLGLAQVILRTNDAAECELGALSGRLAGERFVLDPPRLRKDCFESSLERGPGRRGMHAGQDAQACAATTRGPMDGDNSTPAHSSRLQKRPQVRAVRSR